jgi:hypothetical protein
MVAAVTINEFYMSYPVRYPICRCAAPTIPVPHPVSSTLADRWTYRARICELS